MIELPPVSTFDDEMDYISKNANKLFEDAIEEYNSGNRSMELRDRFRKLRPCDHEVAQPYIDEIEKQNNNLK